MDGMTTRRRHYAPESIHTEDDLTKEKTSKRFCSSYYISGPLINSISKVPGLRTILFSCDVVTSGPLYDHLFLQLELLNIVTWCDNNSTFDLVTSVSKLVFVTSPQTDP